MSRSCESQILQKVHMKLKKTMPKTVMFFDERTRIADLFVLLITIDKRVNTKKFRQKKRRKTKPNYKNNGSPFGGPCFYLQLLYLKQGIAFR